MCMYVVANGAVIIYDITLTGKNKLIIKYADEA